MTATQPTRAARPPVSRSAPAVTSPAMSSSPYTAGAAITMSRPAGADEAEEAVVREVLVDLWVGGDQAEVDAAHHQEEASDQGPAQAGRCRPLDERRQQWRCRSDGHGVPLRGSSSGFRQSLARGLGVSQGRWSRRRGPCAVSRRLTSTTPGTVPATRWAKARSGETFGTR